jgi:hypothetical protein
MRVKVGSEVSNVLILLRTYSSEREMVLGDVYVVDSLVFRSEWKARLKGQKSEYRVNKLAIVL